MFIRKKKTRSAHTLQLVESFRDAEGRPRQRVVLSLGKVEIDKKYWREIAQLVEDRLRNRPSLFGEHEYPQEVLEWTARILRRIEARSLQNSEKKDHSAPPVVSDIEIAKVTHEHVAQLGPAWVGWHFWLKLRMHSKLKSLGFNQTQCDAAAISVINRIVDPVTENALPQWMRTTALPELIGNPREVLVRDRFYRVSDLLYRERETIQAHLNAIQDRLFSLDRTIVLYDLTNTHFEGEAHQNPKAHRGNSKQKRNDGPLITVGLSFDRHGFPLSFEVFEGNVTESKTLEKLLNKLAPTILIQDQLTRSLIIMDAGLATKANLSMLRDRGLHDLVNDSRGVRKKYLALFEEEGFTPISNRANGSKVETRLVATPDEEQEWILLCRSEGRRQKESAMLSQKESRFQQQLTNLSERLAAGRLKDPDKIDQRIGRLRERYPSVAKFYEIEKVAGSDGKWALKWSRKEAYEEACELHGCYVLRTNCPDMDSEELWHLYMTLTKAEAGFRLLKSDLGLRPNHHQKEERVEGHVFICVLAYHLLQTILHTLELSGDTRSWRTICRLLQTHCYSTIVLPSTTGVTYRVRRPSKADPEQEKIYSNLGMDVRDLPSTYIQQQA